MFDFIKDSYSGLASIIPTLLWGILVFVILKYRHYLISLFVVKSNKQHVVQTSNDISQEDPQESEIKDELNAKLSKEKKIDNCAMLLQDLKSIDQLQADELNSESLQLRKNLSELAKRSKLLETESVHDNDSMVVNFPNEDDQDEVDIADLTPDDITVSDEDENNDANISPQAMADIEAELLDSSILDESLEEFDKLNSLEHQGDETTTLTNADQSGDLIEEALENVANSAVWLALEEIGVEVVLDNLNFDDLSNFVVAKQLESRNERSFGKESIAEKSENSINFNVSAVNSLSKGDFLCELWHRPDSLYKELNEEICPAEKSVEEVGRVFEDLNTLDAGDAYCSLQKHLRLNQPTKTSERQSVSEKYSSLVELVASFVSGKAITDAAEEILKDVTITSENLAKVKMEKISRIHMEKKRLSEEELAEERRTQQNQLSDILTLMEENPQMFGSVTKQVLSEQANLYCI